MSEPGEGDAIQAWTEDRVKALLRQRGVKTPNGMLLAYPLAVKVCSPEVLHKTDVGGVALNLAGRGQLERAVESMRTRFPQSPLLVETMEEKGVEVIVGAIKDATFGPALMLGLGGTLAELYRDVTFRLVPISRSDAESMLADLRGKALLNGFRGVQVDRAALMDLMLIVSGLVEELGDRLVQMDLNPVFARPSDVVVVDAKLLLKV
jgi:hypothetical protein